MASSYGALALLGFVVGVVGTSGHRYSPYWGLVLVLGLVMCAGLFSRAWRSWGGLLLFAVACIATVQLLYYVRGPGGSIVILGDTLGQAWMYGGVIVAIIPAIVPSRFVDENEVRRPPEWAPGDGSTLGRMGGSNSRFEEKP
jgi:hypothetical protein